MFSTANTKCHPGLYLFPKIQNVIDYIDNNCEIIKVETLQSEIHKAGNKWRCRWFKVIGIVKL